MPIPMNNECWSSPFNSTCTLIFWLWEQGDCLLAFHRQLQQKCVLQTGKRRKKKTLFQRERERARVHGVAPKYRRAGGCGSHACMHASCTRWQVTMTSLRMDLGLDHDWTCIGALLAWSLFITAKVLSCLRVYDCIMNEASIGSAGRPEWKWGSSTGSNIPHCFKLTKAYRN